MQKIRVFVVDDHTIVRDGICALLAFAGDIEVVGVACNGKEALEAIPQMSPDIVLMDISMPMLDGLEATRRVCKEIPGTKVIALSQYDDKDHAFSLLEAGASGFISKNAVSSELTSAIRYVYNGASYLSPSIAKFLIDDYKQGMVSRADNDPYKQLTDREKDVFKLIVEGYSTQEIAGILVISPKTVAGHKANLMAKLDIDKQVDLVKYALRKGIVDL